MTAEDRSAGDPAEAQLTSSSTAGGGQPASPVDNEGGGGATDPALAALDAARGLVRGAARARPVPRRRRRPGATAPGAGGRGGYSGARPDDTDPQPLGRLFADHVEDRGWQRPLNEARVFSDWPRIVGAEVASHCVPTALRDGELRVSAQSTAWATQLRLLAATLLARIVAEVGGDVVRRIVISGPAGPSWRHGPRSVRGARGPRDTYG